MGTTFKKQLLEPERSNIYVDENNIKMIEISDEDSESDSIDEETLQQAVKSDSGDEELHEQKLSGIRGVMKSPISRELV